MKRTSIAILAGILLAGSVMPTFAEGLLGGLVSGSGGSGLVTIGSGDAGSNGTVNVGLGGGSGNVLDARIGSGSAPLAGANIGNNRADGLAGINLGGQGTTGNLVDVNLLTGRTGTPGQPGQPGAPGQPGNPGMPGLTGGNGSNGINGFGGSSKVGFLARLLENRAWLRFAAGNAICLPPAGIANVGALVGRSDANRVNQLLGNYAGDIGNLRNLMKKCGSRTISQADIERAIAVDLRRDGTVVLYVL